MLPLPPADRHAWGSIAWLASAARGGTAGCTLGRVVIDAGSANPPHRHDRCEEVLHLLSGTLLHRLGDAEVRLRAGDTLLIPAGVVHCGRNNGDVPAEMIVAYNSAARDFIPVT